MADLRHRLRGLCLRYLHAARPHADRTSGAHRNAACERGARRRQSMDWDSLLCSRDCRRDFRIAWRVSDRLAGPPPHPDVEHLAVCGVHVRQRVRHQPRTIPAAALRHVCGRLGGICRRHGLARGAIYATRTTRGHHRYYAGVCVDGRPVDQLRLLPRRHLQPAFPIDSRRTSGLALYGHVGTDSGDSPDRAAAISAGIAHLETKEGRGNAETPELRRTLSSGVSQDGA